MHKAVLCPLLASLLLAACSKPTIPDHDDRPEPQASMSASPTPMREAMQQPIDKAKTAQTEISARCIQISDKARRIRTQVTGQNRMSVEVSCRVALPSIQARPAACTATVIATSAQA